MRVQADAWNLNFRSHDNAFLVVKHEMYEKYKTFSVVLFLAFNSANSALY